MADTVFISGATGYMGTRLAAELLRRGCAVRALVRTGSEGKLPPGATAVFGNALDGTSFTNAIAPATTFVHLVGTSHPAPWKGRQFREVDVASVAATLAALRGSTVRHLVYVSVAHPAPVMKSYIAARQECESMIRDSGISATILRPWYVLGPGHRWPLALVPLYSLAKSAARTRETALRLDLVTIDEMIAALAAAVQTRATGVRVVEVPAIRAGA